MIILMPVSPRGGGGGRYDINWKHAAWIYAGIVLLAGVGVLAVLYAPWMWAKFVFGMVGLFAWCMGIFVPIMLPLHEVKDEPNSRKT